LSELSARALRRIILEQSWRAGVGHIGSALSIADIIAVLYGGVLRIDDPDDPDRDRFVLSKGHAVLALYAALHLRGWLAAECLNTFCGDGSILGVHPERALRGVDFSTGSLGQGLTIGCGAALGARLQRSTRRVVVLISDAECNEGSTWEAAMFAAHHQLTNLIVVLDCNGQQALGLTAEVLRLSHLAARWRAFDWDVQEVDGHDWVALRQAFDGLDREAGPPHLIIAHTTFGKGVSYMENQLRWHYLPMTESEYLQALREVGTEP
jgi:transketolase